MSMIFNYTLLLIISVSNSQSMKNGFRLSFSTLALQQTVNHVELTRLGQGVNTCTPWDFHPNLTHPLIVHASTSIKDGMLIQNIEDNSWQHPQVLSKAGRMVLSPNVGSTFRDLAAMHCQLSAAGTAPNSLNSERLSVGDWHSLWTHPVESIAAKGSLRGQSLWPCCSSGFWTPGLWPLQPEAIIG